MRKFILCSIFSILSLAAMPLAAQTGSLRLEGIVWDPQGNPLSGVSIFVVDQQTGYRAETASDSDGYYRFLVLPPGIYNLSAKIKEYKDVRHQNIYLFSPGSTTQNISFEISAVDKEIGPGESARALDSDIAASFTQKEIEALPLLDRDPSSLALYQPGVQINGGNEALSTVNGLPTTMSSVYKDAASISDPVNPGIISSILMPTADSISSFQIITAGASAEHGGTAGSHRILTTRQGSKSWSGSIYDYVRHSSFDANEYFNELRNIDKPKFMRNLFGGNLSGHLSKKTSIFGSFEGNRTDQQLYKNRLVLTDDARKGIFKWYSPDDSTRTTDTVHSYNIATNDPIGIDPLVASAIKQLPYSNNTYIGDGLNLGGYEFQADAYTHRERADVRVDHEVSAKHRLFLRFDLDRINATDTQNGAEPIYSGSAPGRYVKNDFSINFGSTYAINPFMINELRAGFQRTAVDWERPDRTSGLMLYSTVWNNPLNTSFPKSNRYPAFEITDNFSHARNVHAFKYGISFRRAQHETTDYSGAYPTATFSNKNGNVPDANIGPSLYSEISEADRDTFEKLYNNLLGRVESVSQTFYADRSSVLPAGSARKRQFNIIDFSGFIQDTWKIKPNFTLNLGVRYEFQTVPKESGNYQVVLDKASNISQTANISDFQVVQGSNWRSSNISNFAPRAGFAWDIKGTASTVLRGSYGLHYDSLPGSAAQFIDQNSYGLSQQITQYPNSAGTDIRVSKLPGISQPALQPQQPAASRAQSIAVLDNNLKTPRIHQFQVSLEHRLFGAIVEAGFTHTRGTKLFQYLNLNQTKTNGDFMSSFQQLKAYLQSGIPVPESNTIVKIFGTANNAFKALSAANFRSNQAGLAADKMDKEYYGLYSAAGISDFYIRNFPQFDKLLFGTNSGESEYTGASFGVRKSTANYGFKAYYTWSQSKDNASSDGSNQVVVADSFNPSANKTFSDFDRTHALNVVWDYSLPFGRNLDEASDMPRWMNVLLAGWNVGSLLTWESGKRFSVYSGLENLYAGTSSFADVDLTTNKKMGALFKYGGTVYWFDPDSAALFSNPAAGQQGNAKRNSFRGPKYFNLDLAFHKSYHFRESQSFQIRFEAYNVFNSTHYALPNNRLADPDFGTINSTQGNPRLLQLAVKYAF